MSAHALVIRGSRRAVVHVTGELDIATAPRIRHTLLNTIARYERVTIDLARLEFCDCTGLSALITAQTTARTHGTILTIRNLPPHLTRLLRHIPHSLPIEPAHPRGMPARAFRAGSR